MRRLADVALVVLIVVLSGFGLWSHGVASGYAKGKQVATNALQPRGSVMIENGACDVYGPDVAPPLGKHPYRAHFVTLFLPDDGT